MGLGMSSESKKQHGFFPGTYDPIHEGHIDIAHAASGHVEKVWMLPNPVNSKSKLNATDVGTRRDLVKIAIAEHPQLSTPEGESWDVYEQAYREHGVDEAIEALSNHLDVDPVRIVGQDVYEKRPHAGKVMVVPRGDSALTSASDAHVLPAVGTISSSAIREKLSRGEHVKEVPREVLDEIKKRGLYARLEMAPETLYVRDWILKKIDQWKRHFDPASIDVELGGSLVSGLFVREGADRYDADVKFIVKDPQDPEVLRRIEEVTGLRYRKTIRIRELPPEKNTSVMMEEVFKLPGISLPIDVEGCVRQGPYFNQHKYYEKLFSAQELAEIRQRKLELRGDKEKYKQYKHAVQDTLVERARRAGLLPE